MIIEELPDEIDFLSFFESEPIYRDIEDAITFGYEYQHDGISLLFYFTALEGRVTLILKQKEVKLMHLYLENIAKITITEDERALLIYPQSGSDANHYYVQVRPSILINNRGYCC
ncbi:hypothetical protein [Providencia sp. Me31A]|uniref:hypothetical protein n=1 Tax=Providencia sp. Me31A TaxID=3392637 RepID=UPI003D296EBF